MGSAARCATLGHAKWRMLCREAFECTNVWVGTHDGSSAQHRGNWGGSASNSRAHEALERLRQETDEAAHLSGMLWVRDDVDGRHRGEEYARRVENDALRSEWEDLCMVAAGLESRVEELIW